MQKRVISGRAKPSRNSASLIEILEVRRMLSAAIRSVQSVQVAGKPNPAAYPSLIQKIDFVHEYGQVNASSGGGVETTTVGGVVNVNHASGNQSEVEIAINKTNPNQLYAVWNGSGSAWGAYS
ncbi:MAG: hypothetical protein ACREJC_14970, partial [Tepidisphaeraceae bacterium]